MRFGLDGRALALEAPAAPALVEIEAARPAELTAVAGHAGGDPVHVRNELLTQPRRVIFAGGALLRRSLRACGRGRQHDAEQRGRSDDPPHSAASSVSF